MNEKPIHPAAKASALFLLALVAAIVVGLLVLAVRVVWSAALG